MIQLNDLRIGNIIMYYDKNEMPEPMMIEIGVADLVSINEEGCLYTPVELTPILLHEMKINRDVLGWGLTHSFQLYDPLITDGTTGDRIQGDTKVFAPMWKFSLLGFGIRYLHELQNIFYSLERHEFKNCLTLPKRIKIKWINRYEGNGVIYEGNKVFKKKEEGEGYGHGHDRKSIYIDTIIKNNGL